MKNTIGAVFTVLLLISCNVWAGNEQVLYSLSYGINGDVKKARALLKDAVRDDPEYPLNYYNLACVYAEEGDKGKMLANLSLAFKHKEQVLQEEQMPDPRSDSSFQRYVRDDDFVSLMAKLGYK